MNLLINKFFVFWFSSSLSFFRYYHFLQNFWLEFFAGVQFINKELVFFTWLVNNACWVFLLNPNRGHKVRKYDLKGKMLSFSNVSILVNARYLFCLTQLSKNTMRWKTVQKVIEYPIHLIRTFWIVHSWYRLISELFFLIS